MNFADIEKLFKDKSLLDHALTHKSWVNEHQNLRKNNERLEFLGDAVLEVVVSKHLYLEYPDKEEGILTVMRANLVNTVSLSGIAENINLGDHIFLSKGEEDTGGRKDPSILADTMEAIIGALYLDSGFETAEKFILMFILNNLKSILDKPLKDSKSLLQEAVQAKGFSAPKYEVVEETGPDHNKYFKIQVFVNGSSAGEGSGKNKSEAAQEAAKIALPKFL